ncbi:lysophospholipid acyltransferase family protein [Aureibaculum sp. 2210JD6-5]|uniref:lysophospholipid acyltransferase family protein n=1 Tax=Aureibaculum sp. 2210JD6-5 TaxID=3103957 RepID=UPI002AAEA1E0|nr:lysophospholipid acyltransferase family protein [Aureibaculum sp. 2210JD6-5]MDY7394830.1 lysophospholipid acyltransferase family protein [Aureibaculum sp. 2210JD6-5]
MRKLLAYPLSVLYYLCFGLTLVVFHPILWISKNVFGYKTLKKSVDVLQFFLMRCLNVLGTHFTFTNPHQIKANQPVIIVANHQSMYDISPIMWYMRKYHPKFISKVELGKGIPSVSYNLRHGGSVLIDRKNPRQSITAIKDFSQNIKENNWAAVIFPEGTRSKNGVPKDFQKRGLLTLFKEIPEAIVVPISINNSWKTVRYGKFPMGIGTHMTFTVHKPLKIATFTDKETLINKVETVIKNGIYP